MADSFAYTISINAVKGTATLPVPAVTTTYAPTGDAYVDVVVAASDSATALPVGDIATLKQVYLRNMSSTSGEWIDLYNDATKLCRIEPLGQCLLDLEHVTPANLDIIADTGKTPDCRVIISEK